MMFFRPQYTSNLLGERKSKSNQRSFFRSTTEANDGIHDDVPESKIEQHSWFSLFMKNLIHEWSQEAIMVIQLDHPQCPKLGQLWMQAEPSESQGRMISKHCFIKRPFIGVKCRLNNKLNFIQFSDIAHPPTPPPQHGKTFCRLWGEFVHSINSST